MDYLSSLIVNDPVLTQFARGYSDNEFILEQLFPKISVNKEEGRFVKFGREMFKHYNTKRALSAESKRIEPDSIDTGNYLLAEHSLEKAIDEREYKQSDVLKLDKHYTKRLSHAIALEKEIEMATLATDASKYPTDNKLTLSSNYYNDSSVDFIKEISEKITFISTLIAKRPNKLFLDEYSWSLLKYHPAIRDYHHSSESSTKFLAKLEDLKNVLEIDIVVSSAKKQASDGSLNSVLGNNIVLAYVTEATGLDADMHNPSFAYLFQHQDYPSVGDYQDPRSKSKVLVNADMYQANIVGSDAGFLIKNPINPANYGG